MGWNAVCAGQENRDRMNRLPFPKTCFLATPAERAEVKVLLERMGLSVLGMEDK